jgi:uncharacterized protein YecT (DUF1311 family)
MAKLSQAAIKAKADEWGSYKRKIAKLESDKTEELKEFMEQFAAATKEINDAYDPKLKSLRDKAAAVEAEVIAWLTEHGEAITLSGKIANAVNADKIGNRVVDAVKFFERAGEKFWSCVTVGVKKAEEAIGKTELDKICTKPKTLEPSLTLKS